MTESGEHFARADGHGFLLGDEGGGYWIGREAISAALRSRDGTGPTTEVTDVILSIFDADLDQVVARIHRSPSDRAAVSRLVPHLTSLNDSVVHQIFRRAADSLAQLALAVSRRPGFGALPFAAVGGVFKVQAINQRLHAETGAVAAGNTPDVGAANMALVLAASAD